MKRHTQNLAAIAIIFFIGILFHHKYIAEFPSHVHAWAESDRYALAIGFVNNDLNFFKPETHSLLKNERNLDHWKFPSEESITAVDFPLHDYIPAIFMKILGDCSPWIFRLYILLYSFIGLFFLYKLSQIWTDSFYKSIFTVIFAATSPVFVYYQGGFLPTIPSLANAIIGIFFYSKYLFTKGNRHFNFCILFLTLAALSRTTFLIPLIAVFGLEFLRVLKKDTNFKSKTAPVAISIISILFYLFYNSFLRAKYGSIFLNSFMPAKSFQNALEIFELVKENWGTHFFSNIHYIAFTVFFFLSIFILTSKRQILQKNQSIFLLLIIVIFTGYFAFSILMLRQFAAHDYYFLDTFYLPLILLLIFTVSIIPIGKNIWATSLSIIAIILFSVPVIMNATNSQKERRVTGYWSRTTRTLANFRNSKSFLDSIGVSKNAKILVFDAYAPNIPLLLMDRKGYPIISLSRESIERSLAWDYDYLVFQNEFFLSNVYSVYPEITSRIKKITDNGSITICIPLDEPEDKSLIEFLGFEDKSPIFESIMTYDTIYEASWQNTQSTSELSYSGNISGVLTQDMKYGLTFKTKELAAISEAGRTLLFSSYFLSDGLNNCDIVVSVNEDGKNRYYQAYNLKRLVKSDKKWGRVDLLFQLPKVNSSDYEFALYIWNKENEVLFIDDFEFRLY